MRKPRRERTPQEIEALRRHAWKPGQSGNPLGAKAFPQWLKEVKRLPKHIAAALWSKWLSMDAEELKANEENWQLSALELGICRAILRDIITGDLKNIEIGLTRICGRLGDAPDVNEDEELSKLTPEELRSRVAKALQIVEMNQKSPVMLERKDDEGPVSDPPG